ncbi:MAG: hypothetical protein AAFN10_08375, partial [Bacteroidota bacterium]
KYAADISYDQYEDTKFDIFLPNSTTPMGLLVYIHGGGFTGGDKAFVYNDPYPEHIRALLSQNIAVATINYLLVQLGLLCYKQAEQMLGRERRLFLASYPLDFV